jgi:hypothetical protein
VHAQESCQRRQVGNGRHQLGAGILACTQTCLHSVTHTCYCVHASMYVYTKYVYLYSWFTSSSEQKDLEKQKLDVAAEKTAIKQLRIEVGADVCRDCVQMNVYVCLYVFMYVFMNICVTSARAFVSCSCCAQTKSIHARSQHAWIHIHMYDGSMHAIIHTYIHTYILHTYMIVPCMHLYAHMCTHIHGPLEPMNHACMHAYSHICIHIHTGRLGQGIMRVCMRT